MPSSDFYRLNLGSGKWLGYGGAEQVHSGGGSDPTPTGYVLEYTPTSAKSGWLPLDGATLNMDPQYLYVTVPSADIPIISKTVLLKGTQVIWSQGAHPYGDTPVKLPNGSHTLVGRVDYLDGTSKYTPAATFTVSHTVSTKGEVVVYFDLESAALGNMTTAELDAMSVGNKGILHGGVGTADTFILDGSNNQGAGDSYNGAQGRVLAMRHPAGQHYGGTWQGSVRYTPIRKGWLSYKFMYGNSWVMGKDRGKLPGIGMLGPVQSNSGAWKPPMHGAIVKGQDGWSARHTIHGASSSCYMLQYIYDLVKDEGNMNGTNPAGRYKDTSRYGDRGWLGTTSMHTDGSNDHVDRWDIGVPFVQNNTWYHVEQFWDIDDPTGGVIETWIDGVKMAKTTYRAINEAEAGATWTCILFHPYIGAEGKPEQAQPNAVWTYFRDVELRKIT